MKGDYIEKGGRREEVTFGLKRDEAIRLAEALRKKMTTDGWTIFVHQNLGWHYHVRRTTNHGTLSVYPSTAGSSQLSVPVVFNCLFARASGCGEMFWHDGDNKRFKDPNRAVTFQLKLARQFVNEITATVTDQEEFQRRAARTRKR